MDEGDQFETKHLQAGFCIPNKPIQPSTSQLIFTESEYLPDHDTDDFDEKA